MPVPDTLETVTVLSLPDNVKVAVLSLSDTKVAVPFDP